MKQLLNNDYWALIDGNYLAKRCIYSGNERLVNSQEVFTGGVFKFLKCLWNYKEKGTLCCVFDGGHSTYRKSIYPEYKVRAPSTDPNKAQSELDSKTTFRILNDIIPNMDIPSIRMLGEEADDVIFILARWLISQGKSVYVITDDSDYLQFVNYGIRVWQPLKDRLITRENFEETLGYKPEYFTLFKAINGDSSDNISGVKGVGEKTLLKLVNQLNSPDIGTLMDFLATQKDKKSLAVLENIRTVKRNLLLVDLQNVKIPEEQVIGAFQEAVNYCKPDPKYLFEAFQSLEFTSMFQWIGYLANIQAHYEKST